MRGAWMLMLAAGALCAGCGEQPASIGPLPVHELSFDRQAPAQRSVTVTPRGRASTAVGGDVRDWRYIVIHHSATAVGNASTIDKEHRARGWDGLGYHFVIDNGNGGPDGRVEVGPRWRQQKWGAHTGNTPNNVYNNYGIGICLVGDFSDRPPSQAQLAALRQLVEKLCDDYDIAPRNVIGHRDAPGTATECPGDALHRWIHNTLQPSLAGQYAAQKQGSGSRG